MAKRRPSGDGMVRKREDGRWEGRIVVGHKKNGEPIHRYMLARTQKELIVKLHDCIEMYRDADLTEDCNMTLGEWLDRWINEYMIFTMRESTLDSYKAMIKNQIKPYLGDRPLSALTTQELQKFYNTVKKKGRVKPDKLHGTELADSMVRGIHMMLHEALDMACLLYTSTGKTVISALDYKRFRKQNPDKPCRLLFVAHREEIGRASCRERG